MKEIYFSPTGRYIDPNFQGEVGGGWSNQTYVKIYSPAIFSY